MTVKRQFFDNGPQGETITDAPLPVPINTALAPWMFA